MPFFFFVGGVEQAAGRVLEEAAGRCVRCGSVADLVEAERVLKLFFVPVWRWEAKDPAFYCRGCSLFWPQSLPIDDAGGGGGRGGGRLVEGTLRCHACARELDPQFRFCPFCGAAL